LARRGRSVSQDLLIGWLWPESNARRARWSLNSAVYSLRRILDESFSALSSDSILLEKGRYRLSPEVRVSSDVEEFDARYERGRLLERAGQGAEAASEYEQAIGLYRGDYLVEDLYEDWTAVERERLINAYVDMLDRLANYHKRTGRTQEAINSRYRLLEKDPYHEESYQFLMRCYAQLGLRGRALHHYELCERMFGNLYGSSPPPEVQALYRELLCEERKE
jgi:DNA-binding SARP family transcriptional activator